jgi:hypothetical protein
MSIEQPIFGGDSSDNNVLNVAEFERQGYDYLIQRRTGGLDLDNAGRWWTVALRPPTRPLPRRR